MNVVSKFREWLEGKDFKQTDAMGFSIEEISKGSINPGLMLAIVTPECSATLTVFLSRTCDILVIHNEKMESIFTKGFVIEDDRDIEGFFEKAYQFVVNAVKQ